MKVLILRPQPGADQSARRARALGLEPVVAPLFTVTPLPWTPPDPVAIDALLLTSANAARLGGPGLARYFDLPCYVVGPGTEAAARDAGFTDLHAGPSNGAALAALARADGHKALLHLCGRDHAPLDGAIAVPVYAAEPSGALPDGLGDMLVLLHSPRAAARFAQLVPAREAIRVAAISANAAAAAGGGWRSLHVADAPRDHALLALGAKLCQRGRA